MGILLWIGWMAGSALGVDDFAAWVDGLGQSTGDFKRLFPNARAKLVFNVKEGIGYDDLEHSFQDPSNIIKVGDTYLASSQNPARGLDHRQSRSGRRRGGGLSQWFCYSLDPHL